MSAENWDEDVDSTQATISAEEYAKYAAPPKVYRDERSQRGSTQNRFNDKPRFGGGGDRDGQDRADWRQSSSRHDGGGGGGRRNNDNFEDSIQVEIDPNKVGMVIGRGGSKIKEIQDMFGVNVKVGELFTSFWDATIFSRRSCKP